MNYDQKETIHAASLTLANAFRDLYSDTQNNQLAVLEVLEGYKQVRRLLPKDEIDGKRFGAEEAHKAMMGEV